MPDFNIKPTHKPIRNILRPNSIDMPNTVQKMKAPSAPHFKTSSSTTVINPTSPSSAKSHIIRPEKRRITPDGEVVDTFGLPHGYWEAKDTHDDLYTEADKKFAAGYPSKNIVVQSPTHALLYQHGRTPTRS